MESDKSDNEKYRKYYFPNEAISVTDEQLDIITAPIKNHYRIIASAGSGKTTAIVCRTKFLLDK